MPSKAAKNRALRKQQYQEQKEKKLIADIDEVAEKVCSLTVEEEIKPQDKTKEPIIIMSDEGESSSGILAEDNPKITIDLRKSDFDVLLNPEGYLEDVHIESFRTIVSSETDYHPQQIYYYLNPERIIPINPEIRHIQLLFQRGFNGGIGHWITTFYDGEQLFIYNSMHTTELHNDAETFLKKLYPFDPPVVFAKVQQQTNGIDCGLYAIANSTSIIFNKKPEDQVYDINKLRSHTADILRTRRLSEFPTIMNRQSQERQNNLKRKSQESVGEKQERLRKDREYKHQKILNETPEENEKRLESLKANQVKKLQNETPEEREKRLASLRANQDIKLQNETSQDRDKRLQIKKTNQKIKIVKESIEEKSTRLNKIKNSQQDKVEKETIDQRKTRLEKMKASKKRSLSKETPEEKAKRLKANNESKKVKTKNKNIQAKSTSKTTYKLATRGLAEDVSLHSLGKMDVICNTCASRNFLFERPSDTKFTHCCRKGKLNADLINDYPNYLMDLLSGNDKHSGNFRENIRKYNSALAFASMGAQIDQQLGRGPFTFRIHGQIYHNTSSIYPAQGQQEKYAQLYIIDTVQALAKRMSLNVNQKCRADVMKKLDELIREINPYCAAYMMLKEVEEREIAKAAANNTALPEINLWITGDRRKDIRRYNLPTCNEVAVVFSSTDGEPPINRDIAIHPRGQNAIPINKHSENCDPMTYPLLFPRGEAGWSITLKHTDGVKKMSPLQFYTNRLADRNNYFNPCLHAGKLTQQFIVDAYVKVESERLEYIKHHQTDLRVELYTGLMDHINNKAANEGAKPGLMMILPSTFQGGSRFMQKMYQNAMAIVREFGKPDLFITVTCNPKWPEITEQLQKNETASDRPDIVARVFHGKIKNMMKEFLEDHIFGKVIAYIYVIEFQKRGLPHMHLLLILDEKDKIRNRDDIDALVCAEIPDMTAEPELYQIVKTSMVHGPCGPTNPNSPCMQDNKCSKRFPKDFQDDTYENINGYPLYRRRNNGDTIDITWPNGTVKYKIDNRWIVPYNPYLSKKYRAHINVEICSSIKSIKYICDYLCKGHDCASVKLGQTDDSKTLQWNEINGYLDARYVSAPESCWRLWEYPLHDKSHAVLQLAVHLKFEQPVVFKPNQVQQALERAAKKNTTLTAWFLLNSTDTSAHQYHYTEIPKHYVLTSDNIWRKRQRTGVRPPIGRMIAVTPKDIERFHLRLLLIHSLGAKSYEDLRTVGNVTYNTFQEAARAKGLLASDDEWEKCLDEAVLYKFPRELRELFAYILSFHPTCDALMLWRKFKDDLIEDFVRQQNAIDIAESKCLTEIQTILLLHGLKLADFGLPEPIDIPGGNVVDTNEQIDVAAEMQEGATNEQLFNAKQIEIHRLIMNAVHSADRSPRLFFIDGPGGTGKTFLYNTTISLLRGISKKVIAVAWTGIAATLLKGGRTSHSTFKLPVPVNETSVCKIKGNSIAGKMIREASIIIWDEVTMAPKYALTAIDTLLKDLMDNPRPFGGKVVVLGGDFRQCLPIVPYTNHRTTIIESSMLCSPLWPLFKKHSLTENMRVNANEQEFSRYLLKVGNGEDVDNENNIRIPQRCILANGDSLADAVFGKNIIQPDKIYDFISRAILCPKNDETMVMNDLVLEKIAGPTRVYLSADSAECEDNNKISPPVELLNKHMPTGMPPHKLTLKQGAIVMLLRNMNPKRGLCNGTRLVVKEMLNNYLNLEIITGHSKGERMLLPRITLTPVDTGMPFILKRRQFPIRLAFSMTINKAQGQTFDYVGINLEKPVFAHGQLYVAMSRVRSFDSLVIHLPDDAKNDSGEYISANIVFKEILN